MGTLKGTLKENYKDIRKRRVDFEEGERVSAVPTSQDNWGKMSSQKEY